MFKEVITTKAGKCSKCGRELKEKWQVYYNYESREIYCKPCYAEATKKQEPPTTEIEENRSVVGTTEGQQTRELLSEKTEGIKFQIQELEKRVIAIGNILEDLVKIITPSIKKPTKK